MWSVVVPVRNERGNVEELLRRVREAVPDAEVIFVDDSDDGTEEVLASLAEVRVIHREGAERDGLSGAVLEGMRRARGDVLAVLDGDLQHPPEILARLFETVESGADVAVASRYAPGGSDGLPAGRRALSRLGGWLARVMVSRARVCTDPTAGCFAVRRSVVEGVQLEATGWKVLLEILARGRWERYAEVPLRFGQRRWGRSKLGPRVMAAFAVQLLRLAAGDPGWGAVGRFLLVGLSGTGVNLGIFGLLGSAGLGAGPAEGWAALGALLWNAAWNEFWTFAGAPGARVAHLARYLAVASVGILMAGEVSALLEWAGAGRWLAGLGGVLAFVAWNWIGASRWAWRAAERAEHA